MHVYDPSDSPCLAAGPVEWSNPGAARNDASAHPW